MHDTSEPNTPLMAAMLAFSTITLIAGIGWSLSCALPIEVESAELQIVSATGDGGEVDLDRYIRDRAPTLQTGFADYCDAETRRSVVFFGSAPQNFERARFAGVECKESQ